MNNTLEYSDKGRKMGCALIFFMIFGILVTASCVGFLALVHFTEGLNSKQISLTMAPLSFGLLAIFSVLRNLKFSHKYTVILDKQKEVLTFYKEDPNQHLEIPFSELLKVRLIETYETSSGSSNNTRKTYYQTFLILKDGSQFWLHSTTSKSTLEEEAQKLKSYLDINIEDETGSNLNHEGSANYTKGERSKIYDPSRFVQIENLGLEKLLSIKKPTYLVDEIVKLLLLVFLGSLLSIAVNVLTDSPTVVQVMVAIIFGGFFILILVFVILINSKKYQVLVSEQELVISLRFPWKILDDKLGKTIPIPTENIKQIRTSRLHEGHFWLSCVTTTPFSLFDKVLFGMGAFAKSKIKQLDSSEHVIGLWEVPNYAKHNDMANFQDLYYIEQWLQEQLGLQEVELDK